MRHASDLVGKRSLEVVFEYDYYDGAVNGLLRCHDQSRHYRFEMLQWDPKQSIRAFGLSLIPDLVARECIQLNSVPGRAVKPMALNKQGLIMQRSSKLRPILPRP